MKTVIVYRSILGTSRQYAEWLHEEIESDIFKFNRIKRRTLGNYDLIILCAGTYASWISLGGYFKRRWKLINDKKVILLVVGLAPIDEELSIRAYRRIPSYIRDNIQYFKEKALQIKDAVYKSADDVRRLGDAQTVHMFKSHPFYDPPGFDKWIATLFAEGKLPELGVLH